MDREQAVKYLQFSGFSEEQIKAIEGAFSCPSAGVDCEDCPAYEKNPNKWIPIKTRPLTNKEKEEYADLGYSEDSIDSMYDCPLPEDGEEVLITTRYDEVTTDTFYRDEGCYFETYCDKDDVKAWMPLPKPYKAEGGDKE